MVTTSSGGGGGYPVNNGVTQVSLIHSSDSVRTISTAPIYRPTSSMSAAIKKSPHPTTTTAPFISANQRMSKPPVRVVAQPPPHQQASSQLHQYHQQNQIMFSAPNNRQHIIPTMQVQPTMAPQIKRSTPANAQFQTPSETTTDYGVKPQSVEIVQRVRAVRRQVADEETELRRLRELEHETTQLRDKNYGREKEMSVQGSILREAQLDLRNASKRAQSLNRHLEEMYRRRQTAAAAALVEQRKMQQQQVLLARATNQTPAQEVVRPRASVEPFQVVNTQQQQQQASPQLVKSDDFVDKRDFLENTNGSYDSIDGSGFSKIPSEPSYMAPSKENQQKNIETSPSPPKDPHPSLSPPSSSSTTQKSPTLITFAPPSFEQKINSSTMTRDSPSIERPTSFGDSLDESRLRSGKTDLVSLRSDSLKATKRRSWAASEGTSMSEAEMIHRLLDEQRRGRSHFIPQLPTSQEEPTTTISENYIEESVNSENKQQENVPSISPNHHLELPIEQMSMGSDTTTEEDASSCSTRSDDGQNLEMEVAPERRTVKGILRRPNEKMNKGRIEFDPLALLLDAALEGELDLVKSSAAKLTDVSQANDEGITALHNAICAGHYEIVRFLIEHDADVNAQDSDGWTPLHCAASCNNLPMVRQLVEGGGCVLASTLSDMETPVEKCEEDEDGYDGCLKYLLAAHNSTGSINTGKVYAAYGYEAEFEDELSFDAGDELTVVAKDTVDKNWWTCKKSNGEKGQVPRTYLALYPALKYRKKLGFVMFDLPLESNNNVE